jgi:hypothetical protein
MMRSSSWTPSIVPSGDDETVYLGEGRPWAPRGRLARGRFRNHRPRDRHHRPTDRPVQQSSPGHRLQHIRTLVTGCFRGCRPRVAPALRFAAARRPVRPARLCRAARGASPATGIAARLTMPFQRTKPSLIGVKALLASKGSRHTSLLTAIGLLIKLTRTIGNRAGTLSLHFVTSETPQIAICVRYQT